MGPCSPPENSRATPGGRDAGQPGRLAPGHEAPRGVGTFDQTLAGIQAVREAGLPLSIATMVHRRNLDEFDQLARLVEEIGAIEWGVDVPCAAGSLKETVRVTGHLPGGRSLLKFSFGGGYHGSSEGYACGRHLLTVLPTGRAVKCGFYDDQPLGDARRGLIECWLKLRHVPLEELECRGCPDLAECAGGCRYRALHPLGRDPLMCALYGQTEGKIRKDITEGPESEFRQRENPGEIRNGRRPSLRELEITGN